MLSIIDTLLSITYENIKMRSKCNTYQMIRILLHNYDWELLKLHQNSPSLTQKQHRNFEAKVILLKTAPITECITGKQTEIACNDTLILE